MNERIVSGNKVYMNTKHKRKIETTDFIFKGFLEELPK